MIEVGEVGMIPLNSITVEDRARTEMGDLTGLEESLKESSLIQPLAVMALADDKYRLLAGGRRFAVLEKNEVPTIPVRIYREELSELELKIIEKSENFYRKDFEYWEMDDITREIHELKQQQLGAKAPGPDGSGWGMRDTAELAGTTSASVSTAIKRSEARALFPELFEKCKTQADATKIIKKADEMITKEAIAKKIESSKPKGKLGSLAKSYIIADFFEGVKQIPDEAINLVEIDPPYAIDLQKAKKDDGVSIHNEGEYNEVDTNDYQVFLANLFSECYRVMAEHSWLICWFAPEPWFEVMYQELCNAGFNTTRMCGIWTKGYGQSKRPEIHLANSYEMFFYAWKGRPALNKPGRVNEFEFPPVPPTKKTHPTERPVELMKEIYDTFAFPGSRILIPFLGSGSGIIAADELGMAPVGFELSKSYRDSFLVKVNAMS